MWRKNKISNFVWPITFTRYWSWIPSILMIRKIRGTLARTYHAFFDSRNVFNMSQNYGSFYCINCLPDSLSKSMVFEMKMETRFTFVAFVNAAPNYLPHSISSLSVWTFFDSYLIFSLSSSPSEITSETYCRLLAFHVDHLSSDARRHFFVSNGSVASLLLWGHETYEMEHRKHYEVFPLKFLTFSSAHILQTTRHRLQADALLLPQICFISRSGHSHTAFRELFSQSWTVLC